MNEMQIFENSQFGQVRTIEEDGKVLFCGSDCARALGYTNPSKALADHCKRVVQRRYNDSLGRQQEMFFIQKGDLYRLISRSKLPEAEKFESWVFDEVLPSIQEHGGYLTPRKIEEVLSDPDTLIRLAQDLKEERALRLRLQEKNSELVVQKQIMQPKADYFDELVERGVNLSFRETAKQLGIGERVFVNFLLEHKYVYRDRKGKLAPYAQHADDGLFVIKECYNEKTNWGGAQTLITPKGRETFRLLMQGLKTA